MNKIEQMHLNAIESVVYHDIDSRTVASKSAEITEQIAIEFAQWIGTNKIGGMLFTHSHDDVWESGYWNPDKRDYDPWTTKELFQEFLKTKQ